MDVDVESRVRSRYTGLFACGRGEGASARSKHTAHAGQPPPQLDLQSLGTRGSAGTLWNGGAGANAGTNSSRLVILGGWWWEAGGRGAGSLGASWARSPAGDLGLDWDWDWDWKL